MIYYLIIATFLFFGYFTKTPKKYYYFSLIILFLFTGFRDISLGDYNNKAYMQAFDIVDRLPQFSFSLNYPFEMGYMLLNSLCKTICNDFRFFQIVYTAISIVLLHFVINKMNITNKQRCLFLFVYFCMRFIINNWIILRQNIAILIIWNLLLTDVLPFKASIKRIIVPYIISCYFHITSLFNFIFFLLKERIGTINKKKLYLYTITFSLLLLLTSSKLFQPILNVMIQIGGEKFKLYTASESNSFNIVYYVIRIVVFSFLFMYYSKFKYKKKNLLFIINVFAIIFGSINAAIFSRFMEYLMIGPYLTITLTEETFTNTNKLKFLLILYIAMIIILIRSLITYGNGGLLKYAFF